VALFALRLIMVYYVYNTTGVIMLKLKIWGKRCN